MGMIALVMEGGVPTEVLRLDVHSGSNVVAVRPQQCAPRRRVVISKPCGILPFQRNDVRPYVTSVALQLVHGLVQRHMIRVIKQAVAAQPFRSGTGGDVLGVALGGLHTVPVLLQGQRDEG